MVEEQDIFISNQILAFSKFFQVCKSKFFKDQFPSMSNSVNKKTLKIKKKH